MRNRLDVDEYSFNDKKSPKISVNAESQKSPLASHVLLNRLSVNQMTTRRWSIEQDIRAICELGLRSIGLWRLKYEEFGEAKTANLLSDCRLNVSSLSWVGGFTGTHGYMIDDCVREAVQVIRYANWVGAKTVVVATGEQGRHIYPHAQRLAIDSLKLLGDYAQECGVQLAVMPMSSAMAHGWTFLTSLQKTSELLSACNHPNVGLCLHSYHALQDTKWRQILASLASKIKLVKLCDGVTPKRPRKQCLPGQGKMNLVGMFNFLESHGYQGDYEIDTWCEQHWKTEQTDQLKKSLNWIKESFPPSPPTSQQATPNP